MVTDYIVAIYLGTSHLVGIIGKKNAGGTFTLVADEVKESTFCIQRGCIHNVAETAIRIKRLILELQNKLPNSRIEKVYIGIGGQSLRSIDHSEVRTINADAFVTEEDIRILNNQCRSYHPDMLDVLAIAPPVYYLDDKRTTNPVGIPCKRIEARYKLIVGQPIIRKSVINSIENQAHITVAGIIVSPLALADAMLSPDEKELGCAVIDFGAGVTSLVVYKNGTLKHLSVIPLGGNLITRDLTSLHLVASEAERLKITYGDAMPDKTQDGTVSLGAVEGAGMREIDMSEINTVVEARAKEIVENVYARLEENGLKDALGAGIVLTGGASSLKNLQEMVHERFRQDVRYSAIRKGLLENENDMVGNPRYMSAIAVLLQGTENCVELLHQQRTADSDSATEDDHDSDQEEEEVVKKPAPQKPSKQKKGSLLGGFGKFAKGFFDED